MIIKTLYVNGRIFTANDEMPFAEAMAVSLGGINKVGTNTEILESVGLTGLMDPKISEFEVIDLAGKTVIPGFIDADIRRTPNLTSSDAAWDSEEASAKALAEKSNALAALGIVAFGAEGIGTIDAEAIGTFGSEGVSGTEEKDGKDLFNIYSKAGELGLKQYVSLYYPWDFIKSNQSILEDKTKFIRDRKVHVAGIELPGERDTSQEDEDAAVNYAKENYLQISVEIDNDNPSVGMIEGLREYDNWLTETGLTNIRVHRGQSDFNPFSDIKKELIAQIDAKGEGENEFIDLSQAVAGYTKYAAEMLGISGIGEIKTGNRACFIITDRSLASIAIEELDQVTPEVTIIDGEIAYRKEGSSFTLKDMSSQGIGLKQTK